MRHGSAWHGYQLCVRKISYVFTAFHEKITYCNILLSRCLQSVIAGCGKAFNEHITQNLLDLIFQALNHTNRFVRETGYQLCASLVRLGRKQGRISKCC